MCGIAGFIAPKASQAWKAQIFKSLLNYASIRGDDATGLAYIDPADGLTVVKDGVKPIDFVASDKFKAIEAKLPAIVMGHDRAATGHNNISGPHDNDNNHPFFSKETGLAVIHNGTVDDDLWRKTVGKDGGIATEFPFTGNTDSEVFLRMVETCLKTCKTMEEAIADACFNIRGTYALVFLKESEPNKIWFVKHDNPIVLALAVKQPYILWASTAEIIEKAATTYSWHYNHFVEPHTPKLVYEEQADDTIVTVQLNEEEPYFDIKQKKFAPFGTKLKVKDKAL